MKFGERVFIFELQLCLTVLFAFVDISHNKICPPIWRIARDLRDKEILFLRASVCGLCCNRSQMTSICASVL